MIRIITSFYELILNILCLNQFWMITVTGSKRVYICLLKCLHWVGSLLPIPPCGSFPFPSSTLFHTDLPSHLPKFFIELNLDLEFCCITTSSVVTISCLCGLAGNKCMILSILKVWVDLNQCLENYFITSFGWKLHILYYILKFPKYHTYDVTDVLYATLHAGHFSNWIFFISCAKCCFCCNNQGLILNGQLFNLKNNNLDNVC